MTAPDDPRCGQVAPAPKPRGNPPTDFVPPVVVGVGRSGRSWGALHWAAAEAGARSRPLRIVHAFGWPLSGGAFDAYVGGTLEQAEEAAALLVRDAVVRARSIVPELEISTVLTRLPIALLLLKQAKEADLLVIGTRGHGGIRNLLAGSINAQVFNRASCPVTVVPPFRKVSPGPSATRVVIGVDDSAASQLAVGFAFQAAARRGVGLTAVRARMHRRRCSLAQSDVERSVAVWRDVFPNVDVRTTLAWQELGAALVAESAGAALTVIASRWRHERGGRRAASASHTVLRHAHSPVAIIKAAP